MLRFNIFPSPTSAVVLNRYEKSLFPEFATLFKTPAASSPLRHIARDPQDASVARILENRSENPITAWRFQWQRIDASGQSRTGTSSSDSYAVDVFRPVADPGSRHLISPSPMPAGSETDPLRHSSEACRSRAFSKSRFFASLEMSLVKDFGNLLELRLCYSRSDGFPEK
jgi:hypothetical protein